MADEIDIATERAQAELTELIRQRRGAPTTGSAHCLQCGEPNDRMREGWGTCGDCAEARG